MEQKINRALEENKIPEAISEYIKKHFQGEFLTDIKTAKDNDGAVYYTVDISHENTLYHLEFNAIGKLMSEETEPIMELDDPDEYTNLE